MGLTLKDIAEYCNVSTATVSMIINGKAERISQATIEKVHTAIDTLGYTPNIAARSMVTKQSKTIGLTVPDVSDYFFSELAKGVGDEADRNGYDLLLCNTNMELAKEQEYIQVFQGRSVDGAIFTPLNSCEDNSMFASLQAKRYPFVTIERYLSDLQVPGVKMNNFQGAYELAHSMTENGHRKIAFITGPMVTKSAQQRLAGYEAALRQMNIEVDQRYILTGDFSYESGRQAALEFYGREEHEQVTAVLASNNRMALGFYEIAEAHGVRIPEELSIAGVGGTRFHPVLRPKITTIDMPIYELGKSAAELLFSIIEGRKIERRQVSFDLRIMDQGTIRPCRNH